MRGGLRKNMRFIPKTGTHVADALRHRKTARETFIKVQNNVFSYKTVQGNTDQLILWIQLKLKHSIVMSDNI